MAQCWPKEIPPYVLSDGRRKAEVDTYLKLRDELDDEWTVFYSRPWWGLDARGAEIDGEADFIVVNPEKGVLFLEVKGGGVSFDPGAGKWTSRDRFGISHRIKDPMLQAQASKHQYLRKLQQIKGWPNIYVRMRHAVVFPDSEPPSQQHMFLGGYERHLFCFSDTFEANFSEWVFERLAEHNTSKDKPSRESAPGPLVLAALNEILVTPVTLRIPLRRQVISDLQDMEVLATPVQLSVLNLLIAEDRFLVEGGAGTGKTVLAAEIALREGRETRPALLLCRSKALVGHLRSGVQGRGFVQVLTADEFLRAESDLLKFDGAFSSVIVDEAQDFEESWWDQIFHYVDSSGVKLRIFGDSNQAIYRNRMQLAGKFNLKVSTLSINLRNTQRIAELAYQFYRGPNVRWIGPLGRSPRFIVKSDSPVLDCIEEFTEIVSSDPAVAKDLAILAISDSAVAVLRHSLTRLGHSVCSAADALRDGVIVDTVANYKGLESLIVFLVFDLTAVVSEELMYVAFSRARSELLIFGPLSLASKK